MPNARGMRCLSFFQHYVDIQFMLLNRLRCLSPNFKARNGKGSTELQQHTKTRDVRKPSDTSVLPHLPTHTKASKKVKTHQNAQLHSVSGKDLEHSRLCKLRNSPPKSSPIEGTDVVDAIGLSGDASDISSATTDKACVRDKGDSSGRLRKLGWSWQLGKN